jgi:aryl-alcohol dehydrogenase-like predicted oxidoreductase
MQSFKEIVLGTANVGMNYGIVGAETKISDSLLAKIFQEAFSKGITKIDTAISYGDAESRIGNILQPNQNFKIITKIPVSCLSRNDLVEMITNSLQKLNAEYLEGVLFHSIESLQSSDVLNQIELLIELREQGKLGHIGLSVYSVDEIEQALSIFPDFSYFQINENILDQRKLDSYYLRSLHSQGVRFAVRSIFLKGLLLHSQNLPPNLERYSVILKEFRVACDELGLTPMSACLNYAQSIEWADEIVVGVRSANDLQEIYKGLEVVPEFDRKRFPLGDGYLIDPRQWG